jgi:hypothetical protein
MGQCSSTSRRYRISRGISRTSNKRRYRIARKQKIVPMNIRDQQCAICLEPMILYVKDTRCGHQFHTHCLVRHKHTCRKYHREYNCPLCRKKI